MNTIFKLECNLDELDKVAKKLAKNSNIGDIYLLKGELGVGKTTFARSFINSLYDKNNILRPRSIKSPSFPIMINYSMLNYDINHYDLYRLEKHKELIEIGVYDSLEKNISIIEWPDLIMNNLIIKNYYLLEFIIIDINKRMLILEHSIKLKI